MISTCVLHSEPRAYRVHRSNPEASKVCTLVHARMAESCYACVPILAGVENFAFHPAHQTGGGEVFHDRRDSPRAPLSYAPYACAVADWGNLELVPYLTYTDATKSRYESERAKNAVNEDAYLDFVSHNSTNPEFKGKFVAFVHGKFQGSDRSQLDLISRMYDKFGNVYMYVGRSSGVAYVETVTPKVLRQE